MMKKVISISLGSSKRDHVAVHDFGGETFQIERIGTNGDQTKAISLIRELDGKVDAFGLGGTDLYIYAGNKRYTFRESAQIAAAARNTPIVDGSGIKNTLERRVIRNLETKQGIKLQGKNVLLVCAVDRFGMAEALVGAGTRVVFGDLLFGLGLPVPIRRLNSLAMLASIIAPLITRLPISLFYPTGERQNEFSPRFGRYFQEADIVAGDFHYIRRYMPMELPGKTVITNTVTQADEVLLRDRGIGTLVTTTPEIGGRSFGTNILEAVLVTLAGKPSGELKAEDYSRILDDIGVEPRIKKLN
jgi:hypothetical protein